MPERILSCVTCHRKKCEYHNIDKIYHCDHPNKKEIKNDFKSCMYWIGDTPKKMENKKTRGIKAPMSEIKIREAKSVLEDIKKDIKRKKSLQYHLEIKIKRMEDNL